MRDIRRDSCVGGEVDKNGRGIGRIELLHPAVCRVTIVNVAFNCLLEAEKSRLLSDLRGLWSSPCLFSP